MKATKCLSILVCFLHSAGCSIIEDCCSLCNSLRCWRWAWLHTHVSLWRLPVMSAAFVCSLYHQNCPVARKVSLGLKVHPKVKRGDPVWTRYPKYLAELSWQFLHACTSVTLLKSVHCLFLFLSSSSQDSIKWLPKSPKLYSGHNWSSQSSRWTSLKGKEGFHGGNLYKLSSANGKWREGRISPEQEAEELEDPDEDVGGFL